MLTPEQQTQMDEKLLQTPDALRRTSDIDYTEGYFFVTLNVHDRLPILGSVTGRYLPDTKQVLDAGVHLTALGEAVMRCWMDIPTFHPQVELLDAQVMPEHFHGLLHLHRDGTPSQINAAQQKNDISSQKSPHLGKVIRGFMTGCTHAYWDILGIDWRTMTGENKEGYHGSWTDWQHKQSLRGPSLFSPGYNDTTPITAEEVAIKIAYIRSNPERRIIKGAMRDCFTIYRNQRSANWTEARILRGLRWDYALQCKPDLLAAAYQEVSERLLSAALPLASSSALPPTSASLGILPPHSPAVSAISNDISSTPHFSLTYLGPRDLLLSSRKLPLVCHRADESLRDQQTTAVLREARAGAVIVSAFISRKERDIRDLLLQEGHPVIEILDNGMSSAYKPWGKAFYYCAEGRLLQITPWDYVYQKDATITRPMCMVMNELARLIAAREDDWWK